MDVALDVRDPEPRCSCQLLAAPPAAQSYLAVIQPFPWPGKVCRLSLSFLILDPARMGGRQTSHRSLPRARSRCTLPVPSAQCPVVYHPGPGSRTCSPALPPCSPLLETRNIPHPTPRAVCGTRPSGSI